MFRSGLLRDRDGHLPSRRLGVGGVQSSPGNVIVANREQAPFAVHFESVPIGPEYRSVVTHQLHSGVTSRHLIERKGEEL
jgi:hypothetical protein